jgi:mono/diheme cytochrome c family protein
VQTLRGVIRWTGLALLLIFGSAGALLLQPPNPGSVDAEQIERGRYVVKIAGCNDCHTAGYAQTAGKVAEKDWLTGSRLGYRGPWGTTYPANLRTFMNDLSEDRWLMIARTAEFRPPMPWFNLHDMTEPDLRAIYHFVRYLGPAGGPVPAYLPPGQEPTGPHVVFPQPPQ